jgi:hypothetical protein
MDTVATWPLGPAIAVVSVDVRTARVRLQGVVTAPVVEATHCRIAGLHAERVDLVLDHDAMLTLTMRSAADAALRGAPAELSGRVTVCVPCTRLAWALEYCAIMTRCGCACVAAALDRRAAGAA